MAPIEARRKRLNRVETAFLLLAAPFLLFPELAPVGTLLALVAVLLIWLLRGFVTGRFVVRTSFNAALLLWLAAVLAGAGISADPDLMLPKLTGLLLGVTLWRLLAVQAHTGREQLLALALFLTVATLMLGAGAAAANWPEDRPAADNLSTSARPGIRWLPTDGAGVHMNELAGTVLLCWPLSLALLSATRRRPNTSQWLRQWIAVLAAVIVVAGGVLLLLTGSRAGWSGAVAGLGALLWLKRARKGAWTADRRRRWLTLGSLAGLVALAALLAGYRWLAGHAAVGTPGPLETLAFRLEVWRYALQAISDFPFTGTGLGSFRRVVLRLYPMTTFPNPDIGHAHNIFLQVALDTGLPGLAAYLVLLAGAAKSGWRRLRLAGGMQAAAAAGILASLVALHVFGLADAIAPGAKPGLLFWWLLGLMAADGTHAR